MKKINAIWHRLLNIVAFILFLLIVAAYQILCVTISITITEHAIQNGNFAFAILSSCVEGSAIMSGIALIGIIIYSIFEFFKLGMSFKSTLQKVILKLWNETTNYRGS